MYRNIYDNYIHVCSMFLKLFESYMYLFISSFVWVISDSHISTLLLTFRQKISLKNLPEITV